MKKIKILGLYMVLIMVLLYGNIALANSDVITLDKQIKVTEGKVIEKYKNKKIKDNENYIKVKPLNIKKIKDNELEKTYYKPLDEKGRTMSVISSITNESLERIKKRPAFKSSIIIPGQYSDAIFNGEEWERNNSRTNNKNINGWVFNKSHLLAYSLGGDNEVYNLIWGTREQNTGTNKTKSAGGMLYIENITRKYIKENKDSNIIYQVIPIYEKNNHIIPRYVYVQATDQKNKSKFNMAALTINTTERGKINYEKGYLYN